MQAISVRPIIQLIFEKGDQQSILISDRQKISHMIGATRKILESKHFCEC